MVRASETELSTHHPWIAWWLMGVAGLCLLTRLLPAGLQVPNLAPVGAMALFAGARIPTLGGRLFPLLMMTATDLALAWMYQYPPFDPWVYASIGIYLLLGATLLRSTESPWRIGGVTLLACGQFFLVTNFGAWWNQALPYSYDLAGLFAAYAAGLPFHQMTLISDLAFSATLFGMYAWLSRVVSADERTPDARAASAWKETR